MNLNDISFEKYVSPGFFARTGVGEWARFFEYDNESQFLSDYLFFCRTLELMENVDANNFIVMDFQRMFMFSMYYSKGVFKGFQEKARAFLVANENNPFFLTAPRLLSEIRRFGFYSLNTQSAVEFYFYWRITDGMIVVEKLCEWYGLNSTYVKRVLKTHKIPFENNALFRWKAFNVKSVFDSSQFLPPSIYACVTHYLYCVSRISAFVSDFVGLRDPSMQPVSEVKNEALTRANLHKDFLICQTILLSLERIYNFFPEIEDKERTKHILKKTLSTEIMDILFSDEYLSPKNAYVSSDGETLFVPVEEFRDVLVKNVGDELDESSVNFFFEYSGFFCFDDSQSMIPTHYGISSGKVFQLDYKFYVDVDYFLELYMELRGDYLNYLRYEKKVDIIEKTL